MEVTDKDLRHAGPSSRIFEQAPSKAVARRPYRGQSHADRQSLRRTALRQAGFEVFGSRGLSEATMGEICGQARVAHRFFSDHFDSLEDLFDVVHLHEKDALTIHMQATVFQVNKSNHAISAALLLAFFRFFQADPRRARILLIDGPWRQSSAAASGVSTRHVTPSLQDIGLRWMTYLHAGEEPRAREKKLWRAFLGMTVQSAREWAQSGFDTPVDELVEFNLAIWQQLPTGSVTIIT